MSFSNSRVLLMISSVLIRSTSSSIASWENTHHKGGHKKHGSLESVKTLKRWSSFRPNKVYTNSIAEYLSIVENVLVFKLRHFSTRALRCHIPMSDTTRMEWWPCPSRARARQPQRGKIKHEFTSARHGESANNTGCISQQSQSNDK